METISISIIRILAVATHFFFFIQCVAILSIFIQYSAYLCMLQWHAENRRKKKKKKNNIEKEP